MPSNVSIRQRILDAALDIVEKQGVNALTQPRVAKLAGVRQSHLTYYFPKKADLFVALLQASHARAGDAPAKQQGFDEAMRALRALFFDPQRMRFFLSIVLEAEESDALRPLLAEHVRGLADNVAPHFNRRGDDPDVIAFIDALRGLGLRLLIEPDEKLKKSFDLAALAGRFGLTRRA